VRLFVAADPSREVRRAAALHAGELRHALEQNDFARGIRWVPEENLHLTVWFLGEVSEARSAAVLEALRPRLRTARFELTLSGFGAFPPSGSPRVLWLGVAAGSAELASAHDEVGERLGPWGFAPEGRSYAPHLTMARIKQPLAAADRAKLRHALQATAADPGTCCVEALTVYRSRTSAKGAVYEPVQRVPLS
jgi:RNA 2',3'-cyclic 3'-phosphodiesterase